MSGVDNRIQERVERLKQSFAVAKHIQIQPKSHLDFIPEQCPICSLCMAMAAYKRKTPGGLRPVSYRVIGTCPRCGHIEEF